MAIGFLKNIKISCLACAVPDHKIENEHYVRYYGEKFVNRFERTTGIRQRFLVNKKQTASDLCYVAAKKILEKKKWTGKNVDALIFISQTPDYKTPSTAFVLQKRLGMKESAVVFDINMGCTAVLYGIFVLAGMMQNEGVHNGLILVGDALPQREVTEDHTESMMFSDAGSAILLERSEDKVPFLLESDGNGFQAIMNPHGERFPLEPENPDWRICKYYMNGDEVFNFATSKVPEAFRKYFDYFGVNPEMFDYYVFHQANRFILRHIANDMGIKDEKIPMSIERYANTNGASIPVTIVDMMERNLLEEKKRMILCGFGIGLSWGIMDFELSKECVLPMIYTNEYFEEGTSIQYL